MVRLLAFVLSLVASGSVIANNGERLLTLQQLCIADDGTGFSWLNGAWVRTRFTTPKYIVTSVAVPASWEQADADDKLNVYIRCFDDKDEFVDDNYAEYNTCLKVQEIGKEWSEYHRCLEVHSNFDNSDEWDIKFFCHNKDALYLEPNGYFHKSFMHANLDPEPEDDYKDSLGIYVGKCGSIGE